ncbi:uncharacterized protein LOC120486592 [Pimephales promelas]|uniref:uncharacterized protein LOC120486592 n=1 Tax=Pimephales promelas TaxID=90988 RepID=UPI001955C0A8|nr:uncharacterized protein LOC120486592 [Pimephales promelas]XP_039538648.1 uncharacterized protein LOC120486592 [Pimephales promelas]
MQLDKQTGDLKITNIRTTDFGEYELKIKTTRGSSVQTFSVKVETDPRSDGVTVVSVTEGDSVILHPDTEILKDDEILWRFREKYDIAKIKKDEDIISTFDDIADGIFRHRLHLNHQTGNLIISDITSKTSGLYEVDIKRRKHIIQKSFNVTITDKQDILSVNEGVDVTLGSGVTELHRDDRVQWRFEHEVVAKVNKTAGIVITFDDVLDGRFRGRLQLDNQTGSLIITHTRTTDSGLYYLDITSDRHVILRKFVLSVCDSCRFPDYVTLICPAFGVAVGILLVACGVSHCRRRRFKQVPRRVIKRSSI